MTSNDQKPLFLFGNGLSIGLSPEFSLKTITQKFIDGLNGDEKDFLIEICYGEENLNFEDFEDNFSRLEDAFNSLIKYERFISSPVGAKFLNRFDLPDPQLVRHKAIIKAIYDKYIFQILNLIRDKVKKADIAEKLSGFTSFLKREFIDKRGFVFTLNYDLLAESIMLEEMGGDAITDFCTPAGPLKGTQISKFDFDPAFSQDKYGDDYYESKIELHHLHGSMSLFYDSSRNKALKFRNEDILTNNLYNLIFSEGRPLYPSIITGGGKSSKMLEYPFDFHFRRLKDLCTYGKFNKLYIVGYSFRDEHVNDLIKRWIKSVEDFSRGLLIVDFQVNDEGKTAFRKMVKQQLHLRQPIPITCFEFGGANFIKKVPGTVPKREEDE